MQQLSLFDFGPEAPKPEKEKKTEEVANSSAPQKDDLEDTPLTEQVEEQASLEKQNDFSEQEQHSVPSDNNEDANNASLETPAKQDSAIYEAAAAIHKDMAQQAESFSEQETKEEEIKASSLESPTQQHIYPPSTLAGPTESESEEKSPEITSDQHQNDSSAADLIDKEGPSKAVPIEGNKEQYFSNDQIGIKIVVKSPKTDLLADQQSTTPSSTPTDLESGEAVDTSFKVEELQESVTAEPAIINKVQPEHVQEAPSVDRVDVFQEKTTEALPTTMTTGAIQETTIGPDVPAAEELDTRPPQVFEQEDVILQTSEETSTKATAPSNNKSEPQPFYIEDQTVPLSKRGRKSIKELDKEIDLIDVPPDEVLFQKQYYPISVVAKWFRVNISLLRFWENEFKILRPKKNKKGDRFFRPEDVKNLQLIYYLLRQKKLTINGAIKHLNSYKEQTEANMQLISTLNEFKSFLLELKSATEK